MTTARTVPKMTGIVEAGKAQGRAAISHLLSVEGAVSGKGVSAMAHV